MQNFQPRTSRYNNRVRFVFYPRKSGTMAKVDLHHRDGGHNHFSGASEKRGIEISVSMVEVGESGTPGVQVESSSPMADCNARYLVLESQRYNKGKLEKIANALDADLPRLAETWEKNTHEGKMLLVEIAEKAAEAA